MRYWHSSCSSSFPPTPPPSSSSPPPPRRDSDASHTHVARDEGRHPHPGRSGLTYFRPAVG
eukprot:847495-Pyramimonas_sp.AAC.1